jgi:hypothetical protein
MVNLASWVFFLNLCYIAYLAQFVVINVVTRVDSYSMRQGLGDSESCEAESVIGSLFPATGNPFLSGGRPSLCFSLLDSIWVEKVPHQGLHNYGVHVLENFIVVDLQKKLITSNAFTACPLGRL